MTEQEIIKYASYDLDNQIIPEYNMTRGQLKEAFEKVQNKENWKLPIDSLCVPQDVQNIKNAIIFFTGSVPTFKKSEKGYTYRVQAAGYYAAVGV